MVTLASVGPWTPPWHPSVYPYRTSTGGIYGYPADTKNKTGKLRLLYECAPMSYLAEQVTWRVVRCCITDPCTVAESLDTQGYCRPPP